MTATVLSTATVVPIAAPAFFALGTCPEPLDKDGRATWDRLFALQAHIRVSRLKRQLRDLRAAVSECNICGCRPCRTETFCAACREADKRRRWCR
jgi:hypothetical protein